MRYIDSLKKIFVLAVAVTSIGIVTTSSTHAEEPSSGALLKQIADNTYGALQHLQNLPAYLYSWMAQDTDDDSFITATQNSFASIGNIFATGSQANVSNGMQQQIMADIIGASTSDFTGKSPRILKDVPNINDLSYGTLIGAPPIQGAQPNPYAYIKNSAALNLEHPYPQKTWQGNGDDKAKYLKYFNTITAIQSYNAYVISQLGANSTATPFQNKLVSQASNSDWMLKVETEELGKVLRQILLFESQNYVLNTQIQRNQQQMVATQAMTNSLLILFNQALEYTLLKNAMGLSMM